MPTAQRGELIDYHLNQIFLLQEKERKGTLTPSEAQILKGHLQIMKEEYPRPRKYPTGISTNIFLDILKR